MATVLSLFLQNKSILQSVNSVNSGRISWYIEKKIMCSFYLQFYFIDLLKHFLIIFCGKNRVNFKLNMN